MSNSRNRCFLPSLRKKRTTSALALSHPRPAMKRRNSGWYGNKTMTGVTRFRFACLTICVAYHLADPDIPAQPLPV